MNIFDEYKDLYYKELEFMDRLNSKSNTNITLLTILGTGNIFLFTQLFQSIPFLSFRFIVFLCTCLLSLFFYIKSLIAYYKSFRGYSYAYFPVEAMYETIKASEQFYNKEYSNPEEAYDLLQKHIQSIFLERFIEDTVHNRNQNLSKNQNQFFLMNWIVRCFIIIIIAFAIYFITIQSSIENVHLVKIVNERSLIMSEENNNGGQKSPPPAPGPQYVFETFSTTPEIPVSPTTSVEKED